MFLLEFLKIRGNLPSIFDDDSYEPKNAEKFNRKPLQNRPQSFFRKMSHNDVISKNYRAGSRPIDSEFSIFSYETIKFFWKILPQMKFFNFILFFCWSIIFKNIQKTCRDRFWKWEPFGCWSRRALEVLQTVSFSWIWLERDRALY